MTTENIAKIIIGAIDSSSLSESERTFISSYKPAGITLFRRNIINTNQLKDLVTSICQLYRDDAPPIISIDQEGGRVARLKGQPFDIGPAMLLEQGSHSRDALTRISEVAFEQGQALRDLGINVNFAPVCDVLSTKETDCIGDRSFGVHPEVAGLRAQAYLQGLQQSGVYGCLKHFPGQGAAIADTHKSGTDIRKTFDELMAWDLGPFLKILPQAKMVMLSHCRYPLVDSQEVTHSRVWIQDLLQRRFNYAGLILSDDMTMGAMPSSSIAWLKAMKESVLSGVELLLVSSGFSAFEAATRGLSDLLNEDPLFAETAALAARKVDHFRNENLENTNQI